MFRRQALEDAGGYDPEFDGTQDLELMNRIVYQGGWDAITLPECHVLYRIHPSATSFGKFSQQRMMMRYVRDRNQAWSRGEKPSGYQDWLRACPRSPLQRFTWWRHDLGALLYRRAGLSWMLGERARTALLVGAASGLHPEWVFNKIKGQVRRS
jgi:hypothetical protein